MDGEPLRPDQLFQALDLLRPGLGAVKAAVEKGESATAAESLLIYYRQRVLPGWMTGHSFDPMPVRRSVVRAGDLPRQGANEEDRRIAADAERHIFHILQSNSGYPPYDYGANIDWDANPVDDIEWPCGMHRLHYWDGAVTRCYSATSDERWAQLWVGLVTDWIRKNPLTLERLSFPRSWDAIQVGIRSQRLAAYLPYYLNSPACTPEFLIELLTSLYNHARRTELMPYPNIDNFVMIETLGLASVAALFPEFKDASAWRKLAMERLATAMRQQVLKDGTHGELVPSYHLLITRYYLELMELFGVDAVTPELREAAENMAEFCLGISTPDISTFFVGDNGSRVEPNDLRPVLTWAGHVFGRPDFQGAASEGKAGVWPRHRNFAFTDGGFFTFRSGWGPQAVWLGLHCGPEPIEPFHSQFDRGTFELIAFGRLLMTDPGVFNYKGGDPGREAFRRTSAHQTLTLNGENSSRAGRCLQWVEDDGRGNAVLSVENSAYPHLTHRRTVFFVQRQFFIFVDEALGTAEGDLDLHFQLTPGPTVINPGKKSAHTDFPESGNVLVWADLNAPVTLEAEEAWFSPKWFEKEKLPAFRFRHSSHQTPVRFVTVVAPYQGRTTPIINACIVEGALGDKHIAVKLIVDRETYRMQRALEETQP